MIVDTFTFGLGHYLSNVKTGVSTIAKTVQKGGKIAKAIQVGSK